MTCCWLAGGCTAFIAPAAPLTALPAELDLVVNDRDTFSFDSSEPLATGAPGTVRDDLGDVGGCWGSASFSQAVSGERPVTGIYWVFAFDGDTGTFRSWGLQESYWGDAFVFAWVGSGSYEVEGDNTLTLTPTENALLDPWTGEKTAVDEPTDNTMQFLTTREGERLRLHFGPADRKAVDPGDDEIYTRFECPSPTP